MLLVQDFVVSFFLASHVSTFVLCLSQQIVIMSPFTICLNCRQDVFQQLVRLQNFENQFLPNALRQFFHEISAPRTRGEYLSAMIEGFSERFCSCNPSLGLNKGKYLHTPTINNWRKVFLFNNDSCLVVQAVKNLV